MKVYLITKIALDALPKLRGTWHAMDLPGDPQGRWLMLVDHPDDVDEATMQVPGVTTLPDPLSLKPLGLSVAAVLTRLGANATDSTYDLLEKARAAGWPMAKLHW